MGVPVATSVNGTDCLVGFLALMRHQPHRRLFENDAMDLLKVSFARGTSSGRAALYFTLLAMRRGSPRTEVVIPAYVCPSVARAVIKAGLTPVLCDVGPHGSGLDDGSLRRVLRARTLAVVTAHLYGYPCDIEPTLELAHSVGARVIEDAAQAFGATVNRRSVGTSADAGIFSFGMSKVLWGVSGGLITCSQPELARTIDEVMVGTAEAGLLSQSVGLAKYAALSAVVRTHFLGPISAVWTACFRGRRDCDDFTAGTYASSHAAACRSVLARIHSVVAVRRKHAAFWERYLTGLPGLAVPSVSPEIEPVSLRYPVIIKDPAVRSRLLAQLRSYGINASEMYARDSYDALCTFAGAQPDCPNSEYLVDRMVSLPTHAYVRQQDLANGLAVFRSALAPPVCGTRNGIFAAGR